MTTAKPTKKVLHKSEIRKSFPVNFPSKAVNQMSVRGDVNVNPIRRATTGALDITFDYPPIQNNLTSSSSDLNNQYNTDNGNDELQQLLSAIHARYKATAERQKKYFNESLKHTVKKSVGEFHAHMDKFSKTMYTSIIIL